MSLLRLANIAFAYPQQSSLLSSCDVDFHVGWTAIVGRNGCGKSTLLDLVDGTLQPDAGRIERSGLRISRCHQSLGTDGVDDFANAWTSSALKWMSLLAIEPEDFWRWDELSPGMRRKWQIGAALHVRPGILILDEPTNHLDAEGRQHLIDALRQYDGIGIVVSHDRAFLDAVCQRTVRIHRGSTARYDGAYSDAKPQWEAEAAAALAQLEAAQAEVRSLRSARNTAATRQASAAHGLSTRSRMSSVRDSDARSTAAKTRAQNAEASISRSKAVVAADLQRAEARLDDLDRPDREASDIWVEGEVCPRGFVLDFIAEPLQIADHLVADRVRLQLRSGERVSLRGPNGCGKTTLLRHALDVHTLPPDRVLYIPQRLDVDDLRLRFEALSPTERQRALHVGAAILLDARAVLDGALLSPGETRKLAVALGFVREPWLVIIDEPTNDLDTDSIERLEAALADFPGALLCVTHDEYFAEAIGARELMFQSIVQTS